MFRAASCVLADPGAALLRRGHGAALARIAVGRSPGVGGTPRSLRHGTRADPSRGFAAGAKPTTAGELVDSPSSGSAEDGRRAPGRGNACRAACPSRTQAPTALRPTAAAWGWRIGGWTARGTACPTMRAEVAACGRSVAGRRRALAGRSGTPAGRPMLGTVSRLRSVAVGPPPRAGPGCAQSPRRQGDLAPGCSGAWMPTAGKPATSLLVGS
jgi:hypothetical protein